MSSLKAAAHTPPRNLSGGCVQVNFHDIENKENKSKQPEDDIPPPKFSAMSPLRLSQYDETKTPCRSVKRRVTLEEATPAPDNNKRPRPVVLQSLSSPLCCDTQRQGRESSLSYSSEMTQPLDFTPASTLKLDPDASSIWYLVENTRQEAIRLDIDTCTEFLLGRAPQCINSFCQTPYNRKYMPQKHCQLVYDTTLDCFNLVPFSGRRVYYAQAGCWEHTRPDQVLSIREEQPFRLVRASKNNHHNDYGEEFVVRRQRPGGTIAISNPCLSLPAGSASFDYQYLDLLRQIQRHGALQVNQKGSNRTLAAACTLEIDLCTNDQQRKLLPTTTLRKIAGGGISAIIEAIWYLRGEDNIRFLQKQGVRFWDAQAIGSDGTFVGYNYGLLANNNGFNQLESNVIQPIYQGKLSRNMLCHLGGNDDPRHYQSTVQRACTGSVQFSAEPPDNKDDYPNTISGYLNLTVNQRSSDVILGLPHDVIAWSAILHLVRDEVERRSGRCYAVGKVFFHIAAGGAHVYTQNEPALQELLQRRPLDGVQVEMRIQNYSNKKETNDLWTLVQEFQRRDVVTHGYRSHASIAIQQAV